MRPSATAAAFLPSSVMMSAISPVAIMVALPMTSAGRFSPFGSAALLPPRFCASPAKHCFDFSIGHARSAPMFGSKPINIKGGHFFVA